jgi:hypothetical protein
VKSWSCKGSVKGVARTQALRVWLRPKLGGLVRKVSLGCCSLSIVLLGFAFSARAQAPFAPAPSVGQPAATATAAAAPPGAAQPASGTAAFPPDASVGNPAPPAAPPAAAAPPATQAAPAAPPTYAVVYPCYPPCRSGFICYTGRCVSACNPPCAEGLVCTERGACAYDAEEGERANALGEQSEEISPRMRERMAYREKPRFTVHGLMDVGGFLDADLMAIGLSAAIGYRQNFAEKFGLHLRVGAAVGSVQVPNSSSSSDTSSTNATRGDSTTFTHVYGEFVPYFGPLGRFYLGPILWGGRYMFDTHVLREYDYYDNTIHIYNVSDSWKGGTGLDMGMLLLGHEQLDINWRVKTTLTNSIPFWFEMGVGFHIM